MESKVQEIAIAQLELNEGQMYGLPKNPRWIRDARFDALKKSISDAPEMLNLRELLVYPLSDIEGHKDNFIVIGGNMRFRACQELGFETIPCKVLPLETPVKKLREYAMKDNEAFGQTDWDILAEEWDAEELEEWGVENERIQYDQWDELPEVEGNPALPNLAKPFIITVSIDKSEKENLGTITELIKQAIAEFDAVIK